METEMMRTSASPITAWRKAAREAEKERSRRKRNARRRFRRQNPGLWADLQARRPELRSPFE